MSASPPKKPENDDPVSDAGSGSGSGSGSASESDDEPIEFLATSRARRSTAGALMSSLINQEADDELDLLFASDEDDEEFEFDEATEGGGRAKPTAAAAAEPSEAADDDLLESSSDEDEEDRGPAAEQNDLSGEQELERQAKAEQKRKRKAQEGLRIPMLRKKVKIDTASAPGVRTPTIPAARPRKKSERISWLPTPEDGPVRSSSRRQTMENKELTHARLKDSAEKRERQIKTMKEAAEQKAKLQRKKVMTQADRLAEAEKTERLNSMTVSRWEEMEKNKKEAQRLRLEQLQNRRLEGPVVTWWTGLAKWVNEKLVQVGHRTFGQASEQHTATKRRKSKEGQDDVKAEQPDGKGQEVQSETKSADTQTETKPATMTQDSVLIEMSDARPTAPEEQKKPPAAELSFLDGIEFYASLNEGSDSIAAQQHPEVTASTSNGVPIIQPAHPDGTQHSDASPQGSAGPKTDVAARNCVVLQNFDSVPAEERGVHGIFFNPRKPQKLQKTHADLCPTTSLPARYRDPQTGIAYANSIAYSEIRHVVANRYAWSGMLGCFVGPIGVGARGVPPRFLAPNAAPPLSLATATPPTGTPPATTTTSTAGVPTSTRPE